MTTWNEADPPSSVANWCNCVDIPEAGCWPKTVARSPYTGYETQEPRLWLDRVVFECAVFGWKVGVYPCNTPVGTYAPGWGDYRFFGGVAISITPDGGVEQIVFHSGVAKNGWSVEQGNWENNNYFPLNYQPAAHPNYPNIPATGTVMGPDHFPQAITYRCSKAGYFQPGTSYTVKVVCAWSFAPAGSMTPEPNGYFPDETRVWTFRTDDVQPPAPEPVAPVISNVSPTPGSELGPNDPISLEITDDSGLFRRIAIKATFSDGHWEIPYDDLDGLEPRYATAGSTHEAITNGHRLVLRRLGGWTNVPPVFKAFAIDRDGAEST